LSKKQVLLAATPRYVEKFIQAYFYRIRIRRCSRPWFAPAPGRRA